jgi:membrane fusion protein, multidrug efflux system
LLRRQHLERALEQIAPPSSPLATSQSLRRFLIPAVAVAAAVAVVFISTVNWDSWVSNNPVQVTNDAYVRAQTSRIGTRVAGAIQVIAVNDFQRVNAGDLLVQVDPAEYAARVAQAKANVEAGIAALGNVSNEIELQYATIAQAEAQRTAALAMEVAAQQEEARQRSLNQTESGTHQKFEQAVAAYAKAQADVKTNGAVIAAQRHQLEVLAGTKQQRAADLLSARAVLQAAELQLSYTTIAAPFNGVVSERRVQQGDYVNVGTNLIDLVPLPNVYVIANYKETQLGQMKNGQNVEIVVDTFSGKKLRGRVQRIAPLSGSQSALLPPDNATGNFTKVIQRIPVRIEFDPGQALLTDLRPGMSATTRVFVAERIGEAEARHDRD